VAHQGTRFLAGHVFGAARTGERTCVGAWWA
jgi:hypothetical protein